MLAAAGQAPAGTRSVEDRQRTLEQQLTRLIATGDGYGSQGVGPVHFGLAAARPLAVEVTFLTREGRKARRIDNVDPRDWRGKALVVKPE